MNKIYLIAIIVILIYSSGFIGITVEPKTEGKIIINRTVYTVIAADEYQNNNIVKLHTNDMDEWKLIDYSHVKPIKPD
ncbi:MAG: hypothetical protein KAJ19_11305 [Gammaproteobacteria bacterium]|nr:hypothetical protein [Gammaproteobacteria bacterium]